MSKRSKGLARSKLFWVVVIAAAARIVLALVYDARIWPETSRYYILAEQLISGDYSGYIGKNVPVYSYLMILTGFNLNVLFIIQAAMGVAVSGLMYLIFQRLSGSGWIGFSAGLAYAVNPGELLFEAAFMPEAVCTFLLALIVYLVVELWHGGLRETWWSYGLLGLVCVTCLLTRPHYQFIPALILLFIVWRFRKDWKRLTGYGICFLLPVVILLGSWLKFQHEHTGKASITSHMGITLMYHAFNFIEYAPDDNPVVKQALLDKRDEYLRETGYTYGAVEAVIPDLMERLHVSYNQVDSIYMHMALQTIKRKPQLYLASVARAMARFYKPHWYSANFGIKTVLAKGTPPAKVVAAGYSLLLLGLFVIFFLGQTFILLAGRWKLIKTFDSGVVFIYALIWIAAGIQAVLVLGENSRFRVSVEPLILGLAVWMAAAALAKLKDNAKKASIR